MAAPLTKLAIEALVARARKAKGPQLELIDEREPGLRIRAGERSATWSLLVHLKDGKRTRVSLGPWPALGIAEARRAAQDKRREISEGVDPNETKRTAAIAAVRAARTRRTLSDVLDDYGRIKLSTLRRGPEVRRALDGKKGLLIGLVKLEPAAITRADIADAVRKRAKTSPISANRSLAYASAFFNWCVSEEILTANPAATLRKPGKENIRDRCHSVSELAEVWNAARTLGYPFGPMYQLLIALPMRREEIAAIRVDEIDLGSEDTDTEAVWTLPSDRTKNGKALRVPLSPLACSIIKQAFADEDRPAEGVNEDGRVRPNPFLFSTTGSSPVSGFTKGKRRLDAAIAEVRAAHLADEKAPEAMPHWTVHDLRTSFTTIACRTLKVPANVADRCLNHVATATMSKIARIYNQDDLFEERQDALCRWADFIDSKFKIAKS